MPDDNRLALRRSLGIALGLAEMVETLAKRGEVPSVTDRCVQIRRDITGLMAILAHDA